MRRCFLLYLFFFISAIALYSQPESLQAELKSIDEIHDDSVAYAKLQSLYQRSGLDPRSKLEINYRLINRAFVVQEFGEAVKVANESIVLSNKNGLDSMESYFNKLLGISYYYMDQRKESIPYFEKAANLASKNNYWELEASCYNNMGAALCDIQKYSEAEPYLIKCIEIMKAHGAEEKMVTLRAYRVLARLYSENNQPEKAEPIYVILIDKARIANDTILLSSSLIFYSDLLGKRGEIKKAVEMGEEALILIRKGKDTQTLQMALTIQSRNLVLAIRYKEAYDMLDEAFYLFRDNFKKDLEKEVSNMEVKYKTEQLKTDKKNSEERAKKQLFIYALSFAAIVLLIIFGVYVWNQRKNAKQRTELQTQKLENLIEGEEKERLRLARDLHDGIVQDLTAVKLKLQNREDLAAGSELLKDLDQAINEVRNISYRMMPVALKQNGLIPAVQDLLRKMTIASQIRHEFEYIDPEEETSLSPVSSRLSEKIELCLYRVIQELLNNVVKHSGASLVSVTISKNADKISLFCEDNGKGFDENKVEKGIGMNGLVTRLQILNGSISFQSSEEGGTLAIASIPLS